MDLAGDLEFYHQDNELDEATIIASMTQNELTPLLRLKSSYDNSYPGIVLEEDGHCFIKYPKNLLKFLLSHFCSKPYSISFG